jgi:hypothetical protein
MQQMEPDSTGYGKQEPGYFPIHEENLEYDDRYGKLYERTSTHSEQGEALSDESIEKLADKLSQKLTQASSKKAKKEKATVSQRLGLAIFSLLLTTVLAIVFFIMLGITAGTLIAFGIFCLLIIILNEEFG